MECKKITIALNVFVGLLDDFFIMIIMQECAAKFPVPVGMVNNDRPLAVERQGPIFHRINFRTVHIDSMPFPNPH